MAEPNKTEDRWGVAAQEKLRIAEKAAKLAAGKTDRELMEHMSLRIDDLFRRLDYMNGPGAELL